MRAPFLVTLVLLAACGSSAPPEVLGVWSGPVSLVISCPGASPQTTASSFEVNIYQAGVTFSGCNDVIAATLTNDAAVLSMHVCTPDDESDGTVVTSTITGGTLSASNNTLTVSVQESDDINQGGTDTICGAALTGTLSRQ